MSMARNTAVIASLTLVSRVLGLARDLVLAAALGAGPVADAFLAALRFPNLFRRLFAEGAFAQAFVPIYAKTLAAEGEAKADGLASEALSVLLAATTALTVIVILAMPWLNQLLFAGYRHDAAIFELATLLTRVTMPYLMAMTLATLFGGMLNARGRFVMAAAAQSVLNLTMLLALGPMALRLLAPKTFGFLHAWPPEQAARVAALAVSVAGIGQAGLVWWGARKAGARTRLAWPRLTPDVRRLIAVAVPGAIAGGALQINIVVSQALASFEPGAITYLNYADRLYQLPLGLIGIAVGAAMLPRLSRLVQAGDGAGARAALEEAVALSMAFTLPAAAAFLVAPYWIIDGVFTRAAFSAQNARATADALFHYGWGVPAFVLAKIYAPAFFARENTKGPMRFALISMAINMGLGACLFFALRALGLPGFVGLAIATSFSAWANVALMIRSLVKRGEYDVLAALRGRLPRVLAAAAVMAWLVWLAQSQRETLEQFFGGKEIAVLLAVGLGALAYAGLAFAFRAVTVKELRSALRREPGNAGPTSFEP